ETVAGALPQDACPTRGWQGRKSGARAPDLVLPLFQRARPILPQQARQRAVGEQAPARLTGGAVIHLTCRIANPLHRRAAHWARLAEPPMHRHSGPESGDLLRKTVACLRLQAADPHAQRSEEHTSELQSLAYLVCRLLL